MIERTFLYVNTKTREYVFFSCQKRPSYSMVEVNSFSSVFWVPYGWEQKAILITDELTRKSPLEANFISRTWKEGEYPIEPD